MQTPATVPSAPAYDLRAIPLELIRHSTIQPRRSIDPVRQAELVASVREKGIETPIGVRPIQDGLFEVVRGERRTLAAETAGITVIPCLVKAMTDAEALESALVENTQRHDMSVVDEARGYADLQKADKRLYTVATIARRTGQPESRIYKLLKLVTLEKKFLTALAEDRLTMGHAERLLRLTPAQRTQAMEDALVWRQSPLFRGSENSWVPSKDELQPVSQLDWFIQRHAAFDPNAEDLQHFLPDVAAAREEAIQEDIETGADTQHSDPIDPPTLLRLSDDSLVRVKLGAKPNDKNTPLSPSKWKQVKPGSCEHAQLGAVTHGGPARVLTVCIARSCAKHWPVAKKAKARTSGKTSSQPAGKDAYALEQERERAEEKAWAAFFKKAGPDVARTLQHVKLNAALVRALVPSWNINGVKERFGVTLSDATAVQVLTLNKIQSYDPDGFARSAKDLGLDVTQVMKQFKDQLAAAAKTAKAEAKKATPAAGKKAAKKGKAA